MENASSMEQLSEYIVSIQAESVVITEIVGKMKIKVGASEQESEFRVPVEIKVI